jgi:hypothetical protein
MSVFTKILGTIEGVFKLGNSATAHGITDDVDGVKMVANDGTTIANALVARAADPDHAAAYLDVKERILDIEFSFDGGSPPAGGDNIGKYGFCKTSGGLFTAGSVYLDSGTDLVAVTVYQGSMLASRSAVTGGTVNLVVNGIYVAHTAAAPYTWTLKGDGASSDTGTVKCISLPLVYTDTVKNSTTEIPANAKVLRCMVNVTTAFGGTPTLAGTVYNTSGSTTLSATTDSAMATIAQYDVLDVATPAYTGPVRLTLSGATTSGAANVLVEYVTPLA